MAAAKMSSSPLIRESHQTLTVATITMPRPPKAPPPRKASCVEECERLEQLPNIGPSMADDLRALGLRRPQDLIGLDPLQLYQRLCALRGTRQDPCVLDTFMAAIDFMGGAEQRPWWSYTPLRKAKYGQV